MGGPLLPLDAGLFLDSTRAAGAGPPVISRLLLLDMKTAPGELIRPCMVVQVILLVLPEFILIPVISDTLLLIVLVLNQLCPQVLDFKSESLVLLFFIIIELGHLHGSDLVAGVVLLWDGIASLSPLLGELLLPLDVVLTPHVVVEGVLARHLDQAKLAAEPLDLLTLLLMVLSLFVGLHLVPRADPDVAILAVKLLLVELILAVVVALGIEIGGDSVKTLGVQKPLLLRPELSRALVFFPVVLVVVVIGGDEVVIQTLTGLVPQFMVLETPELHEVLVTVEVAHHAVPVIEGDIALSAVETP